MVENPPSAMSWQEYSHLVMDQWQALLNSEAGLIEKNIQDFLERHPCMVPGAHSMSISSGHAAYPTALIRQPKLPGFSHHIPDFMWLATDSLTNYAVMIEIESPKKQWFTSSGRPSADFTQAHDQLHNWRIWIEEPANQSLFMQNYWPTASPHKSFRPEYVLIYGRRNEFERQPSLTKKRFALQRDGEYHMTFDRLAPDPKADQYITVTRRQEGYVAEYIPPTIKLGPMFAERRALISGKDIAVDRSELISPERKAFLKKRFMYWDGLLKTHPKFGFSNLGDWE
jgi:hypothetical protein